MRLRLIVAAAALLSASLAARADTTEYTVTMNNLGSYDGTIIFDEPTLETTAFTVDASQFLTSTNMNITSVCIVPAGGNCDGEGGLYGLVLLSYSGLPSLLDGFSEDFTSYSDFSDGYITVDIADVAATPEPSSFILLGTGLLGVAGVMRRRLV